MGGEQSYDGFNVDKSNTMSLARRNRIQIRTRRILYSVDSVYRRHFDIEIQKVNFLVCFGEVAPSVGLHPSKLELSKSAE